ncbi:MAG: alanine dehydrogenase [Calditrichaeota bacterium]|nr:MAG: alanine dehydrogenase [Calditrichota bacterium]
MIFGIPLEIKTHEYRVGALPYVVDELVSRGHRVLVENRAGLDSGATDEDYQLHGAEIVPSSEKLYGQADFILKVREPMPVEYELIRPEHTIFAFFHFLNNLEMARALVARGCSCFAYEWLTAADGTRPIMAMNGQIAGKIAIQQGMYWLEKHNGGRGKMLANIPGAQPARVTIVGAGAVGQNAARMAAELGATVYLLDTNYRTLQRAKRHLPENVITLMSHEDNLRQLLPETDLLISAVYVATDVAPVVIRKELVQLMPEGSVIVDVDIDSGGGVETSKATTHANPVFVLDGVIHYCVPNLLGVVPYTASRGLSAAVLPYLIEIAEKGFVEAVTSDPDLRSALAVYEGRVSNRRLAEALQMNYFSLDALNDSDSEESSQ